jgi:uncharacterized protein YhaN
MRITDISVDGFGCWNGLKLECLSDSLTVFHGANEAGKSTLLQFLRAMLYGASSRGGSRYVPPLNGGQPGGSLNVATRSGRFTVSREFLAGKGRRPSDNVAITRADGTRERADTLNVLLSGVDEAVYQNVYAIGLREVQELGTLSDTDAARLLYDLSAGLDRVSLVEVMRNLKNSRQQLLSPDGEPCDIAELLNERQRLTGELDEQRQSFGRYSQLSAERSQLAQEIESLEGQHAELEHQARVTELAASLRDKWLELTDVGRELDDIGRVATISAEQLQQFEQLGEQIAIQQRDRRRLKAKRQRLRDQASALPVNHKLCKQGPRIEALAEQRNWIASIETEIDKVDADVESVQSQLAAEQRKLGGAADLVSDPSGNRLSRAISKLREPARAVRDAKRRVKRYEEKLVNEEPLDEFESAGIETTVDRSMAETSELIESLKTRIELDKKFEKLAERQEDLDEEREELLEEQVLSPWAMLITGGVFVLGVVLLLASLLMSSSVGSAGWALFFLGGFGIFGVIAYKRFRQFRAEEELEDCQREMKTLKTKIKEAEEQRNALDAELPTGGGPLAFQLRKAEKDLAVLEQKQTAGEQTDAANDKASQLRRAYQETKRSWHRALHELGLPPNLSPGDVRELATVGKRIAALQEQLESRQEESEQRWSELNSTVARVEQLLQQSGLDPLSENVIDQVDQLDRVWNEQQEWLERLDELKQESRTTRAEQHEIARAVGKMQTRRRAMLRDVGAEGVEDYRQLAQAYAQSQVLEQNGERLQSEIATALAETCSEDDLAEQLDGTTAEQLERRWDNLAAKLQQLDNSRKECLEKRGRIGEQLRALASDRRMAYKQMDLHCVERRLDQSVARWRQLAVTGLLLDSIRRRYETERQPATLHMASRYMETLTEGRYRRIWTPLDEDQLRVDDARGKTLTTEMLSSGTREQVFLSLRLALITLYAQRGVNLPLVLDDVLVNFDETRARAAAKVLSEFANDGHQMLIFTCHEHLFNIFQQLDTDARRLPSNGKSAAQVKRRKKKKRTRVVELPAPPPEPEVEEVFEAAEPLVEQTTETSVLETVEPPVTEMLEPEFADDGEQTWEVDPDEVPAATDDLDDLEQAA